MLLCKNYFYFYFYLVWYLGAIEYCQFYNTLIYSKMKRSDQQAAPVGYSSIEHFKCVIMLKLADASLLPISINFANHEISGIGYHAI